MAAKLTTKPTVRRIKNTSKTVPRLDPAKVAEALGAEPSDGVMLDGLGGGPLSLHQVRQELFRRLHSTGGRPSLLGTSGRKKVPLNDEQGSELAEIASEVASPGFSPSAGQIASISLTLSLRSVRKNKHKDEVQEQQDAAKSHSDELAGVGK